MVSNKSVIFNSIPAGFPVPGETLKLFDSSLNVDAPLKGGEVLAKTVSLSLDPYLRGRMRSPEIKSYSQAFEIGKPIDNFGVSEVVKSANSSFKKGDHLYGVHTFSEYQLFSSESAKGLKVLENKEGLPWTTWVGAAGMPGQTAWLGLDLIAKPKKGETIFVSGASGAVGQIVIGLCKRLGLKTIGSAGSDDKVAFLRETLGVDVAFNYKTTDTRKILQANPFSIYWDNVGGETLDIALETISDAGRIVACGTISTYNGEEYGVKNTSAIFAKSLLMQGFIVIQHDISKFYETVPKWIASGELKTPKEYVVKGLDDGAAFVDLLKGRNSGKAVISLE